MLRRVHGLLPPRVRGDWRTDELSETLDPDRFHFYRHIPPEGRRREAFDRVVLRFARGEYREPNWHGYPVIPELVQSARFDIARDAMPSDAKGSTIS